MTKEEKAIDLLERLMENKPHAYFHNMDMADKGILFVLRYLAKNQDKEVNAGELAKELDVTTGRIASLLKKIQERNLIVRYPSPEDARRTIVELTPNGKHIVNKHMETVIREMMLVMDDVGVEDIEALIRITKKVKESFESRSNSFNHFKCKE